MYANPRLLAVKILNQVETEKAFAEPLLDSCLSQSDFKAIQDKRLVTQIVYGTLRLKKRLDWIIDSLYHGKSNKLDIGIRNIVRTALYQILYTDRIPHYAAINEAVGLAKKIYPGRAGLVNALLRNALRKIENIEYPSKEKDPAGFISVFYSHPRWLVERWLSEFGFKETAALCAGNNEIPPLILRVNFLKGPRTDVSERLCEKGYDVTATKYSPQGLVIKNPFQAVRDMDEYRNGYVQIQDEASQLVSYIVDPQPGERILDVCSGVGVKASHMAELMQNQGEIVALDISFRKKQALELLAGRLGIKIIEPLVGDARRDMGGIPPEQKFDRILVDVPCSGLGTLRRNPEIRWHLTPDKLDAFSVLQREIVNSASSYLKAGGTMVYSTCTIMTEENEAVIAAFLAEHPDFQCLSLRRHVHEDCIKNDGKYFRTFPYRHGIDGFFAAVLRRNVLDKGYSC